MRQRLSELAVVWKSEGIEMLFECRMGVHTGFCTVGNFGSDDRLDYTIIGSAVNIASRLEALAMPGQILISFETFAHVQEVMHCEEHGQVEVKGSAYPVATYEVIDTFEALEKKGQRFRAEQQLELDLAAVTGDDRGRAMELLRSAQALILESDTSENADAGGQLKQAQKNLFDRLAIGPLFHHL